ncbi:MAG: hypothetical protein AAGD43_30950 [Pseudomonadota bacterium]
MTRIREIAPASQPTTLTLRASTGRFVPSAFAIMEQAHHVDRSTDNGWFGSMESWLTH